MLLFWIDLGPQGISMPLTLQANPSILTGLLLLTLEDLPSPIILLRNVKLARNLSRLAAISQPVTQGSGTLLLEKSTISRYMLRISTVFPILLTLMNQLLQNIHLILLVLLDNQEIWLQLLILSQSNGQDQGTMEVLPSLGTTLRRRLLEEVGLRDAMQWLMIFRTKYQGFRKIATMSSKLLL